MVWCMVLRAACSAAPGTKVTMWSRRTCRANDARAAFEERGYTAHTPTLRHHELPLNEVRQYFPKGSDLSVHSEAELDQVAAELNDRPRKRLRYRKPIEEIGHLFAA